MDGWVHKSAQNKKKFHDGDHRFEHWYADNQVYFITARCAEKFPAFASEEAKRIFWDRFAHWTAQAQFTPWVTSLMSNHYHVVGYCKIGLCLGQMMRRIHGSAAKLVNDLLPERCVPFWSEAGHQDYFDGCIRDEKQCRLAFRYTLTQSVRHGICTDWREYPHTKVNVELERGVKRALELRAFLEGVRYRRYDRIQKKDPDQSKD
jgi:REP element-mobilizing transposase RayT